MNILPNQPDSNTSDNINIPPTQHKPNNINNIDPNTVRPSPLFPSQSGTDLTSKTIKREARTETAQVFEQMIKNFNEIRQKYLDKIDEEIVRLWNPVPSSSLSLTNEPTISSTSVNTAQLRSIKKLLKEGSEFVRMPGRAEYVMIMAQHAFCIEVYTKIEERYVEKLKSLLGSRGMSMAEKKEQVLGLIKDMSILTAYVTGQARNGGQNAFHNLEHIERTAVATGIYYEGTSFEKDRFVDAVHHDNSMSYRPSPALYSNDPTRRAQGKRALDNLKAIYETLRNDPDVLQEEINNGYDSMHLILNNTKRNAVSNVARATEQRRIPGWRVGSSERNSWEQKVIQETELLAMARQVAEETTNHEQNLKIVEDIATQLQIGQEESAVIIKGTIPEIEFPAPDAKKAASKFLTITNMGVIPTPQQLAKMEDAELRQQIASLMDSVLKEVLNNDDIATFQRALDDMKMTRRYYQIIDEIEKGTLRPNITAQVQDFVNNVTEFPPNEAYFHVVRIIAKEVLIAEISQKTGKAVPSDAQIPRFEYPKASEGEKDFFLHALPSYDEPMLQLGVEKIDLEPLVRHLKSAPKVVDYLINQVLMLGVSVADLGSSMLPGADQIWAYEETVALWAEEHDREVKKFFALDELLVRNHEKIFPSLKYEKVKAQIEQLKAKEKTDAWTINDQDQLRQLQIQQEYFTESAKIKGLSNEYLNRCLLEKSFRESCGIDDDLFYSYELIFKPTLYQFIMDQESFALERSALVTRYIYEPMKALKVICEEALNDTSIQHQRLTEASRCIDNFEKLYTIEESNSRVMRHKGVLGIRAFIQEGQSSGRLSEIFKNQMSRRCGKYIGHTLGDQMDPLFIKEQLNLKGIRNES